MLKRAPLRLPLMLTISLSLTACETASFNGSKPTCPPIKTYSAEDQKTVDTEMTVARSQGLIWPRWIVDYGRLRAECRAITTK